MALRTREPHALVGARQEIHTKLLAWHPPSLSRVQDLFNRVKQAIRVPQHHIVELPPLLLLHTWLASLQRFKVEPDRRDRRLELMRDGIHERVMLLVAPNLADQERGVQDKA